MSRQYTKKRRRHPQEHFIINKITKKCPKYPTIPHINSNFLPGNDFYNYVNNNWNKHAHLMPFNVSIGVSEEIEDKVDKELEHIYKESHTNFINNVKHNNDKYILGTLVESIINNNYKSKDSINTFNKLLMSINCIRSVDDICSTLGEFMVYRIQNILVLYSGPEDSDPLHWRLHISPGQFGLPDDSYYNGTGPGGIRIFNAYLNFLNKIGREFNCVNLEQFVQFESKYIKLLESTEYESNITYTLNSLKRKYKYINWDILFNRIFELSNITNEKKDIILEKIVIDSEKWITLINYMCKSVHTNNDILELWKAIFQSNIILHCIKYLPYPYYDTYIDFYSKRLRGITEKMPKNKYIIRIAQDWLTIPLSRLYISYYITDTFKNQIINFADTIKYSAMNRIQKSKWLDKKTRNYAEHKVDKMKMGILYPEKFSNYKPPELNKDNLLENILRLGISKSESELKHISKCMTSKTWDDPVFAVNAYYYNQGNRLILPAGIVNWPFYCTSKEAIAWNYGALGSVIGHEITHAFDVDGMIYDSEGKIKQWWTQNDYKEYTRKTKKIINVFNKGTHFNHKVNGKLTLSENISDLGGVAIALDALKKSQIERGLDNNSIIRELQIFFISYAISWRIKERRKKAIQGLFIDKHAPSHLRVNFIVNNFDEWYMAFDIKPTNKLFILPEERITIF